MGLAGFYERALDQLPGYIGGMGYYPLGLPVLREAIAADYVRRGLPTNPEQIIVTAGALSGVASIARSILGPGARVLAESPSYPNSVSSLRQHGARMTALPIGPEGSDVPGIETALARGGFSAMLCLPDFHNPTGTLLGDEGRERWAGALDRHGVHGIVDETNAELWLDSRPERGAHGHILEQPHHRGKRQQDLLGRVAAGLDQGAARPGWRHPPGPGNHGPRCAGP